MPRIRRLTSQLLRFGWLEVQSCVFAIGVFAGLAVAYAVPLPMARYDFLLLWCLALTFGFWAVGLETWREVLVIFGFHALGLALEIFKVQHGSWLYPGDAVTKVAGSGDRLERGVAHGLDLVGLQRRDLDGVVIGVRARHGCLSERDGCGASLGRTARGPRPGSPRGPRRPA